MCKYIYNPEKTYPKGTPFTYSISWTDLDIHYYGVRYSKKCHPDDLWKTYFTSSKIVKKFRILNGEPNIIKVNYVFDTGEEAREYEYNYIKNNNCLKDKKWLNQNNGGKDYCCLEHTDAAKQKISLSVKGRIVINNGIIQKFVHPEDAENIYFLHGFVKGALYTTRQKISDTQKGKIYINNGIVQLKVFKEEAEILYSFGFIDGQLDYINEKRSNASKGRISINNGIIQKLVRPEDAENIYYPQGFVKGDLIKNIQNRSERSKGNKNNLGKKRTPEQRQRISESKKGISNGPCKEETKLKISLASKGRKNDPILCQIHSERMKGNSNASGKRTLEQRQRMSESAKNRPSFSKDTRLKMSASQKKRKTSDVTKKKLRDINLGKTHTDESKQKMSISAKKRGLTNTIWVCSENNKKQIKKDQEEYYISKGYIRGMKFN